MVTTSENYNITLQDKYLCIEFAGPFSIIEAKKAMDAMVAACKEHEATKVLFDIRPMTGEIDSMDRFEAGIYGAEVIGPKIKIAMLGRRDHLSPDKFFENVAVNRGVNLRVFIDFDEATTWLES